MDIKPLRRIEHFLAKIAGSEYAKDLVPVTRKEYWLNEIAKKGGGSGGGGLLICTDTSDTLDKTMGEIQEAFTNGTLVYIKIGDKSCIVTSFQNVVYDPADHKYIGYLAAFDVAQQSGWQYKVGETTESAALAAYPTFAL